MPPMTGQEVLGGGSEVRPRRALPVVVLPGVTDDRTEIEMMEAWADDYVRQPFAPDRFVARIKAALQRAEH